MALEQLATKAASDKASAIFAAIPYAVQGISAISQARRAKKLGSTPRPTYEIPDAAQEALSSSRMQALSDMPGMAAIENKLGASTANTIGSLQEVSQSPSALLAGAVAAGENQNENLVDLGIQNANYKDKARQQMLSQLGVYANYQDKQWNTNKYEPYINAMNAAKELRQASRQNAMAAVRGLSGVASMYFGGNLNNKTNQQDINGGTPTQSSQLGAMGNTNNGGTPTQSSQLGAMGNTNNGGTQFTDVDIQKMRNMGMSEDEIEKLINK